MRGNNVFHIGRTIYPYMADAGTISDRVLDVIADYFYVLPEEVKSKVRKEEIITARHLFHYFMYHIDIVRNCERYQYSLAKVGDMTGRDHATVINSINRVKNSLGIYGNFGKTMDSMREELWLKIQSMTEIGETVKLNLKKSLTKTYT